MLLTVTGPLIDSPATPVRLAIILPIVVAAMTWIVMTLLTRRCAEWPAR
ncbi:hypothetical protein ACFXNW_27450 [Nocardia sp. NPDC059180]